MERWIGPSETNDRCRGSGASGAGFELQEKRKMIIILSRIEWQKFTEVVLNTAVLDELSEFCAEFLIHAVDDEGESNEGLKTVG